MAGMKITLEIPDPLYRRIKATAALSGKSMREFFTEAAEEKLTRKTDEQVTGWRAVWGKLPKEAADEMDAIINAPGFREIEPEMWKWFSTPTPFIVGERRRTTCRGPCDHSSASLTRSGFGRISIWPDPLTPPETN